MIAKKYFLICVLSAACHAGFAQKKTLRPITWILKQAIGPGVSVASYPKAYPTNSLMSQYATSSINFQLISVQRYFGNWGAEVNLAAKFNVDNSDDLFKK